MVGAVSTALTLGQTAAVAGGRRSRGATPAKALVGRNASRALFGSRVATPVAISSSRNSTTGYWASRTTGSARQVAVSASNNGQSDSYDYDLIIIGCGVGGHGAALHAVECGLKTVVIEGHDIGGTCVNRGCVPSKALLAASGRVRELKDKMHLDAMGVQVGAVDFKLEKVAAHASNLALNVQKNLGNSLTALGVEILKGVGKVTAPHTVEYGLPGRVDIGGTVTARNIIIATGSVPFVPPGVPIDGKTVFTSDHALKLEWLPDWIAIIGSGYIGLEFSDVYTALGSDVTFVEAMPNIMPGFDKEIAKMAERTLIRPRNIDYHTNVLAGKTMMMDLLVDSAHDPIFKTRRVHFHDFMLDVHTRLRKVQKSQDPLAVVAATIAAETRLLCLDEFFVTDVADAMILARLFGYLWEKSVVLVATSNRHPDKLYEGGLQRQLFLPFIASLKDACTVHDLASPVDYRRLAKNQQGTYFIGPTASSDLQARVDELALGNVRKGVELPVQMGRTLSVPLVAGCVARFTFNELCGEALGAADYTALCDQFHTIAIDGLPIITAETRSQGYRFVTLIDLAYEHRCRMLLAAEAAPLEIFQFVYTHSEGKQALKYHDVSESEIVIDDNLGFAKDRTVSRLIEMQSDEYWEQHAMQRAPQLLSALHEAARAA